MSSEAKAEEAMVSEGGESSSGIIQYYRKTKAHAEAYPYVWASYILVYGGFGLWLTYRWRKLRQTEDRVRALQERLRKKYEAEELAQSTKVKDQSPKDPPPP